MKAIKIGQIELGSVVDITDPCYDKNVWCRMTTECQSGNYTGYAKYKDCGAYGNRVEYVAIFKDGKRKPCTELIGRVGVDAGLCGFFNNKPDYVDDIDENNNRSNGKDSWLEFCRNYSNDDFFQVEDYGICSSSGFGDGMYDVFASEDRSAFKIIFL